MADEQHSKKCILGVAARLFAKLGLDKCSTREIAKESNANISLISYYFGGKEGLYREVMLKFALEIKEYVQIQGDEFKKLPMTKEFFNQKLHEVIETIVLFRKKYPEVAQIFAREKLTGFEYSKDIHEEIFFPLAQNFFELIRSAQDAGVVRSDINPALYFTLLTEGIWGYFLIESCPIPISKEFLHFKNDTEELKKQFFRIYIEGVLL
ncbi:MAG: hypothetical protein A2622_07750 [Bdellovibrionales bacterium RIFCSPHIGHO2_01_FULL_40_29]|nr:MAG: hypothetical protein A2622_07750 [Bdellovibrionales bacterium RIFCSPHIGHO2_01_FULL_40_29]OFZ34187.1 MAG: hypothetical protein A3D17_03900 [Bdellovibrionales bacterium RIFCSPHIGHO2_02_FULL_40_15]